MEIKTRIELARHFKSLGFTKGAEIGVSTGNYSICLFTEIPGLTLLCVDTWMKYHGIGRSHSNQRQNRHYKEAIQRLKGYDAVFMRMKSMEAVKQIPDGSLDFVFIDANHQYEFVLEDIREWSKKVRPGGIVSGHDYYNFHKSGIIEAVATYIHDNPFIELNLTTTHEPPDESICFWWVKP